MSDLIPVKLNADISDSSNKIIVDLFGPSSKQLGMALGNIFGLINTLTMPVKFINEYATRNFGNVGEKISQIPEENIKPVEPEIAIPLIEKLSYTSNEELAEIYATLLANASNKEKIDVVHPGFINKINSMAPDEAKILSLLKDKSEIYYISFIVENNQGHFKELSTKLTGFEKEIGITTQQMQMHLENMISLSILEDKAENMIIDEQGYKKLIDMYSSEQVTLNEEIQQENDDFTKLEINKSFFQITMIGKIFIQACVKN